ncbi:unnamed protein product [Mytilus edulis]|uniref:Peptidase C19 ubiquitin carboxyl-terminal hydrolase domain-containing protein n=1 Tax=Mytilus edulis TaxID=6550 RepID=A0A8S3TCP2_MYTED|nr:unnamed protein product [Mytilus edulis]
MKPIPSKAAWASGVVLVRKKDGSVRWCVDYRKLNQFSVRDAYPLPKISICLDCLANASLFSVCDLQSGYWQLRMAEEDSHKTAFVIYNKGLLASDTSMAIDVGEQEDPCQFLLTFLNRIPAGNDPVIIKTTLKCFRCKQCCQNTPTQKEAALQSVPNILVLQLKRFTNFQKKINTRVKINETNNCASFVRGNEDYTVYNEVVVQTTATQTDDKYDDHEDLKKQHNKEMNNLADYIVRLERKLPTKDHEIMQLKRQSKNNEPFIQGFNEMWEDQVREKKVQRDRKREDWRRGRVAKENMEPFSPPSKKIKSLMKKLF